MECMAIILVVMLIMKSLVFNDRLIAYFKENSADNAIEILFWILCKRDNPLKNVIKICSRMSVLVIFTVRLTFAM